MSIIDLNTQNLKKYINENMIIKFYAKWCSTCDEMDSDYNKLKKVYPNIIFSQINIDEEEDLSERFNIKKLPTIIYVKNGILLGKTEKKLKYEDINNIINKYIL